MRFFPSSPQSPPALPRQSTKYDDLLRFLQAKHPAIRAQDLDFEGKNRCLWWAPELRHELPAPDSNPTSVKSRLK